MLRLRFGVPVITLLLVFSASGCGGGGHTPLYPVNGRVTLDGEPLAGKTLKFIPDPGTPGLGGGGTTKGDGRYVAIANRPGAIRDMNGLPAGAYRVTVEEPMFPLQAEIAAQEKWTGVGPPPAIGLPKIDKKKKKDIPTAYGSEKTTPLRVEVVEGGGLINLDMEGDRKNR